MFAANIYIWVCYGSLIGVFAVLVIGSVKNGHLSNQLGFDTWCWKVQCALELDL